MKKLILFFIALISFLGVHAQKYTYNPGYFESDGYSSKYGIAPSRTRVDTTALPNRVDSVGVMIYWKAKNSLWVKTKMDGPGPLWIQIASGGDLSAYWDSTEVKSRFVPLTRSILTTAPLTGGSAMSGDVTLGITAADGTTTPGYVTTGDQDFGGVKNFLTRPRRAGFGIYDQGNDPPGSVFNITTSGPEVISSITTNTNGRVTWVDKRSITAGDLNTWDSSTIKTNFPIDTVATITALQAYTGKAKVLLVKDTLRGGVFSWGASGVSNGGTVFSGNGGYWTRTGVAGIYNVKWWGAKGDYNLTTGTNDYAAIAACVSYLSSIKTTYFSNTSYRPTLYFPNSDYYLISSPLVIPAGINVIADGEIAYNGSNTAGAITIGTAGELENRVEIKIRLRQRSIPTWVEPQMTSNYGIKIINAQNCKIDIPYVIGFCNNIILEGDNTGGTTGAFSYNEITIGSSIDAVRHLVLNATGTLGWVNENKFNGGNFQNSSSTSSRQESRYGIVMRSSSAYIPNNNAFYKPAFQLGYSFIPDKVADSAIAIFLEKGNINNFYDIRSENSGPILMVTKDVSFGNYAYANVFGLDNKDQLVDLSSSRNNFVISDSAKYTGAQSGAVQIFNSGFLPEKINKYNTNSYYIPGVSWAYSGDGAIHTASGSGVSLNTNYVAIAETERMGVFVQTDVVKQFAIKWDVVNQKGGRIFVRLYDGNGSIITPTSTLISPSSLSGNTTSFFGGGYVVGSDRSGRYYSFAVDTSVKKIYVAIGGGTDSLKIKSWQLFALNNIPASAYSGVKDFGGFGVAAAIPTEIKPKGTVIYNDLSVSAVPLGWQNTDGATTWIPMAAPNTGGAGYIQNQSATTQTATYNISDTATVSKTGKDTYGPYFRLTSGVKGAALQMGDPTASESTLSIWTTGIGTGPGSSNYSERMRISPTGVAIGSTTKLGALTVGSFGGVSGITSTSSAGGLLNLYTGAGPTANLGLGLINFGSVSVSNNAAGINAYAAADWTGISTPSYITFRTTPVSSVTSAEVMRITEAGNVAINKTTAAAKVDVNGDVAAVHYIGNSSTPTFTPNGATNSILGTGYTFTISGNDAHMYITITTGTGITTSGTIGDIVFNTAYSGPPVVVWSPGNINALSTNVVGFNGTLASTVTVFSSAVLLPSTTYNYNIITGK